MTLDPDDLASLARACARRFRSPEAVSRFGVLAGLPPDRTAPGDVEAAWAALLAHADEHGTLGRLAGALAREAPGDETFQALARTLGVLAAPARSRALPLVGAGAALGLLLVGGAIWALVGGGPSAEAPPSKPATATAPATPTPAPTPPASDAEAAPAPAAAEAASDPAPPAAVEAPPPAPEPPDPAPAAPAPAVAKAAATRLGGGCAGAQPGEVVGYWYAGTENPGAAGSTITLTRDARVRADYPRKENRHDSSAPERCVLSRGSRVTLHAAPIEASRGYWWVPLVAE